MKLFFIYLRVRDTRDSFLRAMSLCFLIHGNDAAHLLKKNMISHADDLHYLKISALWVGQALLYFSKIRNSIYLKMFFQSLLHK